MRRLNRYRGHRDMVVEWYSEFCETDNFRFSSLRNFKPVKRIQNRNDDCNI